MGIIQSLGEQFGSHYVAKREVSFDTVGESIMQAMRAYIILLALVLSLAAVDAVEAQYRSDAAVEAMAQSRLYEAPTGFTLDRLFDPQFFQMGHSYEMSFGSGYGQSGPIGEYTNSMMWRFSNKLAARIDVGVAHGFGNTLNTGLPGSQSSLGRVYLKNAEVKFQPLKNLTMHLSYRQAPLGYGRYLSPYGRYGMSPYGNNNRFGARIGYDDPYLTGGW